MVNLIYPQVSQSEGCCLLFSSPKFSVVGLMAPFMPSMCCCSVWKCLIFCGGGAHLPVVSLVCEICIIWVEKKKAAFGTKSKQIVTAVILSFRRAPFYLFSMECSSLWRPFRAFVFICYIVGELFLLWRKRRNSSLVILWSMSRVQEFGILMPNVIRLYNFALS